MRARPTIEEYFMSIAQVVATRSTCARRQVGCVLVDGSRFILATGYNGVARGQVHCIEQACAGSLYPSGLGLDRCEAIHAEQNAIIQCRASAGEIAQCYVTCSPCVTCIKMLLNTGCVQIISGGAYAHDGEAKRLWLSDGRRSWTDLERRETHG